MKRTIMTRSIRAGLLYFAGVFAAGFLLGVLRGLALLQFEDLSPFVAILIELPFILLFSWILCNLIIRQARIGLVSERALMGASAVILLMLAELALSVLLERRTLTAHIATYLTPDGALGLSGQILFALFPLFAQRPRTP
jgi:hypothetical protein